MSEYVRAGNQNLLAALVNKLGDPKRLVASKAGFLLTQVTQTHPNMKGVVVTEVVQMMHRSNISQKSQYYGIVFLNQLQLRRDNEQDKVRGGGSGGYVSYLHACMHACMSA